MVIAVSAVGTLKPSSIVSHRMGLSEAADACWLFEALEATKIILDPRS